MDKETKKKVVERYLELANPGTEQARKDLREYLQAVDGMALLAPVVAAALKKGCQPGILQARYKITYRQVYRIGLESGHYPKHRQGSK